MANKEESWGETVMRFVCQPNRDDIEKLFMVWLGVWLGRNKAWLGKTSPFVAHDKLDELLPLMSRPNPYTMHVIEMGKLVGWCT